MLTLNDGRAELWQWDTGRTLAVDANCSQVHFSNKVFGRSIDVDVVDGAAIIPDILLQTDKDLNVWAFVGTAENGYTKISKTFKVNRRNKPADYVFTPVEQTTIDEIASIAQSVRDDADAGLFNGTRGSDGGYYTPAVEQPNANTMRLSFSPSKEGMPAVAEKDITLPSGGGGGGSGGSGEDGGYYTPAVTQTAENTMQVVFTPSKATMPAVSGTEITLPDGPRGAAGKSAYQYAVEGGYTGTEAEFAAKLAAEKFANPNALTFTGAVTGSYDGSAPLEVKIPSGGGASGDYIPNPSTASVGQTIVVKATDENGKPTEWEAADMAAGWRLINDITLSQSEVSYVEIMEDLNGKPFSCSEIYAAVFGKASKESGWNILVCCSTNPSHQNLFHNFGLAGSCLTTDGLWAQAHIEHISDVDWSISMNKSSTGSVSSITQNSYTGLPRNIYNSWTAKPDGDIRGVKIEPFSGTFSEGFRVILYGKDA